MENNLFSVFLGTYNAEPWIHQVIQSLESQDSEPFSVVIIDNDSTDKTISIIKEILESHSLKNDYRLFKNQKNIGAISSFLDQLDLFDSEWIVMIHQDDHYHSDHLSTLKLAMSECSDQTSVLFTAMSRIDGEGRELITPPTLSSKISEIDRFENFLMSLQIFPVNFPACALRKADLKNVVTSRHTTAFNDTEMILRMMCVSDVKYIPKETMHYRTYSGNASSITGSFANDKAVFIGFNELFHSKEVTDLLSKQDSEKSIEKLIDAIKGAIEIRLSDQILKNLIRVTIAESLHRLYGFKNHVVASFLSESLMQLNLEREASVVINLSKHNLANELTRSKRDPNLSELDITKLQSVISSRSFLSNTISKINLPTREIFFDLIFSSPLNRLIKRPFAKVWHLRNRKM